jgi:cytolysin (calcineurin-like family phosphatase)
VKDIRTAMEAIRARTGVPYTSMIAVMGAALWNKLVQTTEAKNLYLNTIPGAAAPNQMKSSEIASAIGLSGIFVGSAVKLTSKEGAADAFTDVWGTTTIAVIAKANRPNLMTPGYGVMISPTVPGFKGAYVAVDKYREEKKRSDIVRAAALFDCVAVTKNLGQIITGA